MDDHDNSRINVGCDFVLPFIPGSDQYHPIFRWLVVNLNFNCLLYFHCKKVLYGKSQMGKIAVANFLRNIIQLLPLVYLFQLFEFDTHMAVLIAFCTLIGSDELSF